MSLSSELCIKFLQDDSCVPSSSSSSASSPQNQGTPCHTESPAPSLASLESGSTNPDEPNYAEIMQHAKGCHLDEDCPNPLCFKMKISLLHFTRLNHCIGPNCQEIACKARRQMPRLKRKHPGLSVEEKVKRAILLSDMMDSQRKAEKERGGIKKPVPVYADEVKNVSWIKSLSNPISPPPSGCAPSPPSPTEKDAIEFFCRAYVNVFARIAKAGKG